jgi:hypothetical protein
VLTHEVPDTPVPGVTFLDNLKAAVDAARAAAGDSYVNILGAHVARLLDWPGGTNVKLERLSVSQTPQTTGLWLRVDRPSAD